MLGELLGFSFVAIASAVLPGPDSIYILYIRYRSGLQSSLGALLGLVTGVAMWSLSGSFGLLAIFEKVPLFFQTVKWSGFVLIVGWATVQGLRYIYAYKDSKKTNLVTPYIESREPSIKRAYIQGLYLSLVNPKNIIFVLSVFPQFTSAETSTLVFNLYETMVRVGSILVWNLVVVCFFPSILLSFLNGE